MNEWRALQGAGAAALTAFSAGTILLADYGAQLPPTNQKRVEELVTPLRARLADVTRADAEARGRTVTLEDV